MGRARAVASAWGGSIDHSSLCSNERRLAAATSGTKLACQIRAASVKKGAGGIAAALGTVAFSELISGRVQGLLGNGSDALLGELSLAGMTVWTSDDVPGGRGSEAELGQPWTVWALAGAVAVLLVGVCAVLKSRRKYQRRLDGSEAEQSV